MSEPSSYSSSRYLRAKTTVDARALNRRVWTTFLDALSERAPRVRILEVGGGIGATFKRVIRALEKRDVDVIQYTLVDINPSHIETATSSLRGWGRERGYEVTGQTDQRWQEGPIDISVRLVRADLRDLSGNLSGKDPHDALIGQAVFDLLPVRQTLEVLHPLLGEHALWYLPIHFDGVTAFEPPVDPSLDAKIERLYHESMANDQRQEGGRSGAVSGRHLLSQLRSLGSSLIEVGGADWIVFPKEQGYPGDEAYFLHHILHFIESELSDHEALDAAAFERWLRTRRQQIVEGELLYIAHHLDILAEAP